MNRIDKKFAELKSRNEKALILFVTAGDPTLEETLAIMEALADKGTDIIELGVPFSDPIADGPVIQRSTSRALKNKVDLKSILSLIRRFREKYDTPIVCMGYLNPVLRYGPEQFIKDFKSAGGDGLIIADLPYEEGEEYENLTRDQDIDLIYLLAPEPGSERTKRIVDAGSGFIYVVSHYGTTGENREIQTDLGAVTTSLRQLTDKPLAIGFGISSPKSAATAAQHADGVIIGSWLIKELEQAGDKAAKAGEFAGRVKEVIGGK